MLSYQKFCIKGSMFKDVWDWIFQIRFIEAFKFYEILNFSKNFTFTLIVSYLKFNFWAEQFFIIVDRI